METLNLERSDGVAVLTLNRPTSKNSLNNVMSAELIRTLQGLRHDPEARVVVITGAGGSFCSGGDVKQMGDGAPRTIEQRRSGMLVARSIVTELHAMDKPVIAAVDGVAYGAGLSIALLADIILVSDRARMAAAFNRMGLVPDLGMFYTLPRLVGLQRAKELVLSAREFSGQEALEMGIAMEVLPSESVLPRALEIARSLAGASSLAMSVSKQALQASLQSDLITMLDIEATAQAMALSSEYAKESTRRFAAREKPQFIWPQPAK